METAHLDELIELESTYWWHVAKRELADQLLGIHCPAPANLVEGGIGAAGNLCHWQAQGYVVSGLDIMPQSVARAQELGLKSVQHHDLMQPWPLESTSQDVAILLDVLEHVAEPELVLRNAAKVLRESGLIIFTVPAYPQLYCDWDKCLGHFRRYTLDMIRMQVESAGLTLTSVRHWNSFSLPAAMVTRTCRRWSQTHDRAEFPRVSPWLNRGLISLARVESLVAEYLGMPCGLSLVGVISK